MRVRPGRGSRPRTRRRPAHESADEGFVAGVDRGGKGFIPVASSTFQEGDYAAVIVQKDALETLEELMQPIGEH